MSQTRRSTKRAPVTCSCWIWLLGGILIGLGISFAISLRQAPPPPTSTVVSEPQEIEEPQPPKFQFYDALEDQNTQPSSLPPAQSSIQPESVEPAPTSVSPPQITPMAAEIPPGSLMLQVAAFQSMPDADVVKNRLLTFNIPAMIHTHNENGVTVHRVRIGPFANREELQAMRQQLLAHQFQAIEVRHE